jgi:hypothetical protein
VNCEKLYLLILGQCTEHMVAKLESLSDFKKIDRDLDVIKLIKAITLLSYQFEGKKYHLEALHQAMNRFYLFNQGKDMTDERFLESVQTLVSVITECGGEIGHNPMGILSAFKDKGGGLASITPTELAEAKATAKERYLAVAMLSAADKYRYSKLTEEIGNDYTKGSNHYPKTVTEAYNLIVNYQWSRPGGRVYNDTDVEAFTNFESTRPPRPE